MNDSFVFYGSWLEIIENNYPDDITKQRELMHNIILYGIRGEANLSIEKMFMQQAYAQIDSAQEKHQRRVEAGRKGGQKSKGGGAPLGNQNAKRKTTSKQQANVNDNDNVNDNVISINNNQEINIDAKSTATHRAPLMAARSEPRIEWEETTDEEGRVKYIKHVYSDRTTE